MRVGGAEDPETGKKKRKMDAPSMEPDAPEADRIHARMEKTNIFGERPEGVTAAQWGALQKLHLNLNHPCAESLKRRLRSYGVKQSVLDSVDHLDCDVCKRIGRPKTVRQAALKKDIGFNEAVSIDEAEVTLPDGFRVMVLAIVDEASGFRMFIPTKAVRSISGKETKELFYRGWCSWAGPPETLVYDLAMGHFWLLNLQNREITTTSR